MVSLEKQVLYLTSRAQEVDVVDLISIYQDRGYSSQYVRNLLFQLKTDNYIVSVGRGRYRITDIGLSFVENFNDKPNLFDQPWSGLWNIIFFEFGAGKRRSDRDSFRRHLQSLGFGRLQDSVYVSPWDHSASITAYLKSRQIEDFVVVATDCKVPSLRNPENAAKVWPLGEIAATYEEKIDWFHREFPKGLAQASRKDEDYRCFLSFLELGDVVSSLGLIDPMLPAELLPKDWKGTAFFKFLYQEMGLVGSRIPDTSPFSKFVR